MFIKAGIHHRNVYVKKYHKLEHLITHKMAWSFQRQASVISIKTVNNMPLPIIGVWEKIIYYARRNCQIFLHVRAPGGGGTCPSVPELATQWVGQSFSRKCRYTPNQPANGRPPVTPTLSVQVSVKVFRQQMWDGANRSHQQTTIARSSWRRHWTGLVIIATAWNTCVHRGGRGSCAGRLCRHHCRLLRQEISPTAVCYWYPLCNYRLTDVFKPIVANRISVSHSAEFTLFAFYVCRYCSKCWFTC